MDPKKLKAPVSIVKQESNCVIIVPDSPMEKLRSPAKKRTKAMHPRVSVSDKGKSKTSMVSTFTGSSSVGAKRNLDKDMFQFIPRNPSISLVDLTNSNERSSSADVVEPAVMKVYSRRNNKGPKINTRTTPAAFHDSLLKLNEAQKSAVREIGFGRILDLKVKDLPRRLAYWILNKFNSETCELEIDPRRSVRITTNDVYRVFGFPSGEQTIKIFGKQANSDLFEQWFSFFGVDNRDKIKIGLLLHEMISCKCGGTWFKRNFMIAMAFSLFESCPSGTVHPFILGCLSDLRSLRNWNWGEYMIYSLKHHSGIWKGDINKVYAGPSLFVILCYVDRLSFDEMEVKRDFPIHKNWSSEALRRRQKIELDTPNVASSNLLEPIQLPVGYPKDVSEFDISDEERFLTSKILQQATEISEMMKRLCLDVDNASVGVKKSPSFQKIVGDASKLTGMSIEIIIPKDQPSSNVIEIEDDPIDYTEEFFAMVDECSVEKCPETREKKPISCDIPSFNLMIADENETDDSNQKGLDILKDCQSPVMGLVSDDKPTSSHVQGHVGASKGVFIPGFEEKTNSVAAEREPLMNLDNNVTVVNRNQCPAKAKRLLNLKASNFRTNRFQVGICTRLKLGIQERQIGMYALHREAGEEFNILFCFKDVELRRYELMSMRRGQPVHPSVINAWCLILNGDEPVRSDKTPARFFASADIYSDCISPKGQSYEDLKKSFFLSMNMELREYQDYQVSTIDLYFFPVYENSEHYAVCVDTIRSRIYILDSTVEMNEVDYSNKYREVCNILRSMLTDYLSYLKEDQKAMIVSNSPIEIARMKCADGRNVVDTGVYLMRHLETFMGDISPNWDCNISNTSLRQLRRMRVRYCASILMWTENKLRSDVAAAASEYYSMLSTSDEKNVDFLLLG